LTKFGDYDKLNFRHIYQVDNRKSQNFTLLVKSIIKIGKKDTMAQRFEVINVLKIERKIHNQAVPTCTVHL
jgi:hypothetical protein